MTIHDSQTCTEDNGKPCEMCEWSDAQEKQWAAEKLQNAYAENLCRDIDEVLASPTLDLQDKVLEAERLRRFERHEFMAQGFYIRCKQCGGLRAAPQHYDTDTTVAPTTTLALLRDIEQRVQRIHRDPNLPIEARYQCKELKELLNRAIIETESKN